MWKAIYVKWVLGECRHLCCLCKYKNKYKCRKDMKDYYNKLYKKEEWF